MTNLLAAAEAIALPRAKAVDSTACNGTGLDLERLFARLRDEFEIIERFTVLR